jgi:uncharacterized LabA/DUF88 family protein
MRMSNSSLTFDFKRAKMLIGTIGTFRKKMYVFNQHNTFPTGLNIYRRLSFRQSSDGSRSSALSPLNDLLRQYSKLRYALLIDGENYQRKKMKLVIEKIGAMGITMPIRRIYDRARPADSMIHQQIALDFVLVKSQANRKNTVDNAIIKDAMDLLHQDDSKLDGFILVSSDSDFCPLAKRLRQAGKRVIGVGQKGCITKKFPKSFDHFIFSDQL